MAGQLVELFASRTEVINAERPSAEFLYMAHGCVDEAEVRTLALNGSPATYNGMVKRTVEIAERLSNDTWKVVVRYDAPTVNDEQQPEPVTSFDFTGGTQHITQSLATVGRYGPSASAQLGGAIGYDGENVAGCDITVPVYNWQETHYLSDAQLNQWLYYALTGSVNNAPFKGFAAGEVLFLGASGQKRGQDGKWEVTFKYAASPNMVNIQVGSIMGIAKKGWEYMWVQYADDVDATAKVKIKKPTAVYIEQVYEMLNFAGLP
ncbi:MAG: hypothetical protein NTW87_10930 [Planctomycetota bacterium]|nr:hypothetical protein [Planctomycetota bacterium]